MAPLNEEEIKQKLEGLTGWELKENAIEKVFQFDSFLRSIAFITRLTEPAETARHHPDITINYDKVTLSLSTHDEGGVTQKDFQLAARIDKLSG